MILSDLFKLLAGLAIAHWIADFPLQSAEMAKKKSEDPKVLAQHVGIHFLVFFIVTALLLDVLNGIKVATVVAATHAAIDWNVWRGYKRLRKDAGPDFSPYADHTFWVVLGADQLFHGLSILFSLWVSSL